MSTRKKGSSRARPAVITLAAQCTIKDAPALQSELLAALARPGDIHVEATAVERVDTAALQVLCALAQHCSNEGRTLQWQGDCALLRDASAQLGLDTLLGLPRAVAA